MTNLDRARDLVRKRVRVDWDEAYVELGAIRLGSRRSRRARSLAVASVLMACAAVVVVLSWRGRPVGGASALLAVTTAGPRPAAPPLVAGSEERPVHFSDGSIAFPADERTRLAITDDTPSRMTAELIAGRSRFEVVPSPTRMFSVHSGAVSVIVIGTVFSVERNDDVVDVSVERGRVRVESPSGNEELSAGERASFRATGSADPSNGHSLRAAQRARPAAADPSTWRTLAEQRRFQEAYPLLPQSLPFVETPRDLLLAADSARLSGHPEAAVKYLAAIVRQYPKDFSAQLAAFSLGSIYLDQLNRPAIAAFRFGQARSLAGTGPLSEDALARELEALVRAGDSAQARSRAEEYVRLFPAGRHVDLARKVAGID